jgi:hypothetical protein
MQQLYTSANTRNLVTNNRVNQVYNTENTSNVSNILKGDRVGGNSYDLSGLQMNGETHFGLQNLGTTYNHLINEVDTHNAQTNNYITDIDRTYTDHHIQTDIGGDFVGKNNYILGQHTNSGEEYFGLQNLVNRVLNQVNNNEVSRVYNTANTKNVQNVMEGNQIGGAYINGRNMVLNGRTDFGLQNLGTTYNHLINEVDTHNAQTNNYITDIDRTYTDHHIQTDIGGDFVGKNNYIIGQHTNSGEEYFGLI